MTGKDGPDPIANPWSARVVVAQIPETGLHRDVEADDIARTALARIAGLRDIEFARASFDLTPRRDGSVHVRGRVSARVGQTCVVSLDPIENDIVEDIDLLFVPEDRVRTFPAAIDDDAGDEASHDVPDAPEPIVKGIIDLGRLATDVLFLGIDPYPRKQDAVFVALPSVVDPEDRPFAALKTLKIDPDSSRRKKPTRD